MRNSQFWSVSPLISRCLVGVYAPTPTDCHSLWHSHFQRFLIDFVGVSVSAATFFGKNKYMYRDIQGKKKQRKKRLRHRHTDQIALFNSKIVVPQGFPRVGVYADDTDHTPTFSPQHRPGRASHA